MCCGPAVANSDFYLLPAATGPGRSVRPAGGGARQARTQGHTNGLFSRTALLGGSDIKGPLRRLELSAL